MRLPVCSSVSLPLRAVVKKNKNTRLSVPTHGVAEQVCLRVSRNNMSGLLYCACLHMRELINY